MGLLVLLIVLIAGLLIAGLLIYLLGFRNSGSSKKAIPTPSTSAAPAPASATSVAPSTPSTPPASSAAGSGGTLTTAAGTSLLGIAANSGARAQVGQMVTGTNVVVQPPLDLKDGFWVGTSPTDAYFVDLADPLATTPTGPVLQLAQGQRVTFTGQLVANTPTYLAEARSDPVAGVDKIAAQGYHISATPAQVHSS